MLAPEKLVIPSEAKEQASEPSRLWLVDFVRQISWLLVLSLHLMQYRLGPLPSGSSPIYPLLMDGDIGVWMFFLVSGFVVSDTANKRFKSLDQIRPRDFYIIRAARLLPLFLIAVAYGIISTKIPELRINPKYNDTFDFGGRTGLFWLALFTGTFNWYRFANNKFYGLHWDIFWSLAIEEQFYVCYPWLLKLKSYAWILASLLVIAPIGRLIIELNDHGMFRHISSFIALDALSAGVLLFLTMQKYSPVLRERQRLCHALLILGATALGATMMQKRTFEFAVLGPSAIAAGLFAFLLGGLNIPWIQKIPNWLVIGGKLSYGAYLIHPAALYWMVSFLIGVKFAPAYATYYLAVLAAAWISFTAFEQPVNRFLRKRFLK